MAVCRHESLFFQETARRFLERIKSVVIAKHGVVFSNSLKTTNDTEQKVIVEPILHYFNFKEQKLHTDSIEDDDFRPELLNLLLQQQRASLDLLAAQLAAVACGSRHNVREADATIEHASVVLCRQRRAEQPRHEHALP